MEKVYYYSRITKQCIEKKKSDLDCQRFFPDISSPANIRNMSNDKSDEEKSISNYCTLYSENICFVISILKNEKEKHSISDYYVTCCMLCVIPHIRSDAFKNSQNKHHIQVNNFIKNVFAGSNEKELHGTLDTFWR